MSLCCSVFEIGNFEDAVFTLTYVPPTFGPPPFGRHRPRRLPPLISSRSRRLPLEPGVFLATDVISASFHWPEMTLRAALLLAGGYYLRPAPFPPTPRAGRLS
ncbi:Hypothetical protein NTJ_13848 [Nesidiocoris tenuis]|uniref:Uncharacterized protein n=1 Tax=Nesidiocoris tenuis TaxID=355587 RepID=A0ABN7B9H4_9HEMI|nr:Hypothetical protein NTJ_13848 [Nesidiocoris tenuis]